MIDYCLLLIKSYFIYKIIQDRGQNYQIQVKINIDQLLTIFVIFLDRPIMIPADIKKMSFSYAKCPAGDLHTGQIMSLVCVDAKCQKRGLICPICRMLNHQDHQVLPLKIFIDQVKKLFLQSQDSASLNNLSDYLRSIDESRKQLLSILRQTAQSIAKELKKVEQKIQQNYQSIRRNILAQSTMSTKLPIFLQTLLKKQENDPYWLQQQFQRYAQLIKFENSNMQISDKAKKIVEDYSELPKQIKTTLDDQNQKIKTVFKDLFAQKAKTGKKSEGHTFSSQNKHTEINISDDKKELFVPATVQQYGMGYVKQTQPASTNKKITFRIKSSSSGSIVLGMGTPKKDKQLAFLYSMPIQNQHFALTSDGYCETEPYQQQQNSIEDMRTFQFNQVGSEVTIHLEGQKNQIVFTKAKTNESKVLKLNNFSEQDKKQLQFFASLGENDRVQIIDN